MRRWERTLTSVVLLVSLFLLLPKRVMIDSVLVKVDEG